MPARMQLRRLRTRRTFLVILLTCLALGLGGPNAWAWYHMRSARSALTRFHPEVARHHLDDCLKVWSGSATAHLLASRAARQEGDFEAAVRHLHACQTIAGGTSDDITLEWALLQAAAGNAREVEEYLQWRLDQNPDLAALVWEALAEGYIRVYRILDALALLDHWIKLEPDNLRALELRGLAYQNGKSSYKGAADFRRVIEIDPDRVGTRWRLILCLIEMGAYDEALPHLERIERERPDDIEVQVRLARCLNMLGRAPEARRLLDDVLASHPQHGLALRTRGQFALSDQRPDLAESLLRQAVDAWPNDYQTHYFLTQALQQQSKLTEAREALKIAEAVKSRSERLGEMRSRTLSERPLDPALHYEMSVLLTRAGHPDAAVRWLQSALSLDPDYKPARAALADYYESIGDAARAAEYRSSP